MVGCIFCGEPVTSSPENGPLLSRTGRADPGPDRDFINPGVGLNVPHAGKSGHETFERRGRRALRCDRCTACGQLAPKMAGGGMAAFVDQRRDFVAAARRSVRTAGMEAAAGGWIEGARQLALDDHAIAPGPWPRNRD